MTSTRSAIGGASSRSRDRYVGCLLAVTVRAILPAAPDRVWHALLDDHERSRWWPQLRRVEAVPGGRFEERWNDGAREVLTSGVVAAVEPGRRLQLRWADEDWPSETLVELELRPEGSGASLRVTHAGWEALPDGAALARAHERGWTAHVHRLREPLAGG